MRFRRVLRFGCTGLFNTGVHALVVTLVYGWISKDAVLSNGVAFLVATTLSYPINTRWTFTMAGSWIRLRRFWIVSTLGLALTLVLSSLFEQAGLGVVGGTLGVVLVLPPFTFLLHRYWTYGALSEASSG